MPGLKTAGQEYPDDDGSADPAVAEALAAYAAGRGSEHAALAALAASRLLMPVVAMRIPEGEGRGAGTAQVALPSVIGTDGRAAVPAFTCLDALVRWRGDARPVPVPAARVWQAAEHEASAAVIDLAGPVPLAVEGARLAALAAGDPAPPPHADPDVLALAREVLAREEPVIAGTGLMAGGEDCDLALGVRLAAGRQAGEAAVRQAIERAVAGIMAGVNGRFRRGIAVVITMGA